MHPDVAHTVNPATTVRHKNGLMPPGAAGGPPMEMVELLRKFVVPWRDLWTMEQRAEITAFVAILANNASYLNHSSMLWYSARVGREWELHRKNGCRSFVWFFLLGALSLRGERSQNGDERSGALESPAATRLARWKCRIGVAYRLAHEVVATSTLPVDS